jgi:hypothetical protein
VILAIVLLDEDLQGIGLVIACDEDVVSRTRGDHADVFEFVRQSQIEGFLADLEDVITPRFRLRNAITHGDHEQAIIGVADGRDRGSPPRSWTICSTIPEWLTIRTDFPACFCFSSVAQVGVRSVPS